MAVELYNKPTLKYRVEGFAFFVCNAWELMLKAKLIRDNGEDSIYYKDSETRTISLEKCIKLVFTNEKDPLRKNLEKIIELRNTSTHFITEEYETIYVTLFQACAYNFADKLLSFHNVNITDLIPSHFINLSISQVPLSMEEMRAKYSPEVFAKLSKTSEFIKQTSDDISNDRFSISIKQDLHLVKSKDPNIPGFRIVKSSEDASGNVMIVNKVKSINDTHPLTMHRLLEIIQGKLDREKIALNVNKAGIQDFIKYYKLKENEKFCYKNTINKQPTYSYSRETVELIMSEIYKDNNVFANIHNLLKTKVDG